MEVASTKEEEKKQDVDTVVEINVDNNVQIIQPSNIVSKGQGLTGQTVTERRTEDENVLQLKLKRF